MSVAGGTTWIARGSNQGLAILLAIAGALLLRGGIGDGGALGHYFIGTVMIVTGVGVWKYWRWARWMALGACFISIAAACFYTVACWLMGSSYGLDESFRKNLAASLVLFA